MRFLPFILIAAVLLQIGSAFAENGVSPDKIVFGQTAVLEGATSALGRGMREGILAAFREANDAGGVHGRRLELLSLDDGYEPGQAADNTQHLIQTDKVFALIGGVGTPTATAIVPIISNAKVPFIGPFSGAQFLRTPFNRYIVNIRASYGQETEALVEHLTHDLKISRIAALYQDDAYGLAGLNGLRNALAKRNMALVGRANYRRNTVAIKEAALKIREVAPEAVVMIGAYKPCAEFVRLSKQLGVKTLFLNISFVGSEAFAKELGPEGEGVIISQVVPLPFDTQRPLVAAYQNALHVNNPQAEYGFISLEGYMVGRLAIEVLKQLKGDVTRENFLNTLYQMETIMLNGTILHYGPDNNQGMSAVFLTQLNGSGHFLSIDTPQAVTP